MRKIIAIIFIIVMNTGCNSDDDNVQNICSFENPVENLMWLKQKIAELEEDTAGILIYQYIDQFSYLGNTVFVLSDCCPVCSTVSPVYNCDGELLGIVGSRENDINPNFLIDGKTVWQPENFECLSI